MTKTKFFNSLKENKENKEDEENRKKMFRYLSFALFPNTGLINKYRYVLNYNIENTENTDNTDNECIIYDTYKFFSADGEIKVNYNSNNNQYTFTNKEKILNYVFDKYYAIFEKILSEKDDVEQISIADLITSDYFKKIDVFYLGILFIYMNNLTGFKTNDHIISQCLNSDYTERYTIDSLKKKFNELNGGNKIRANKSGGRIEIAHDLKKDNLITVDNLRTHDLKQDSLRTHYLKQDSLKTPREITFKDEDEKYEIDTSYKYSNRFTAYDDYIPENLEININEFIKKIKNIKI